MDLRQWRRGEEREPDKQREQRQQQQRRLLWCGGGGDADVPDVRGLLGPLLPAGERTADLSGVPRGQRRPLLGGAALGGPRQPQVRLHRPLRPCKLAISSSRKPKKICIIRACAEDETSAIHSRALQFVHGDTAGLRVGWVHFMMVVSTPCVGGNLAELAEHQPSFKPTASPCM